MRTVIFIIFLGISLNSIYAQTKNTTDSTQIASVENLIPTDSIPPLPADSVIKKQANIATAKRSDIETTINYNSKDSMVFDIENQKMFIHGDGHIDYDIMSIEGNEIEINWEKRTLSSKYSTDSTGRKVGKPVFTQKDEIYETNDLVYNFKTKRALIKGVVTERDGAFMHGEDVKKNEFDELFIKGGKYSTCNLADPHFFIESDKIKVVPGKKILFGSFLMKFRDIPTPLWGPFGMVPQPKHQASGIIFPSYGEEKNRGFFLRDMGYYLAFNDYVDLRLTGDIYSKGAHNIDATSNYRKRYKYSGSFNFSYGSLKSSTTDIENPVTEKSYWVKWSHKPETRGNSSFSASVSMGTTNYSANNNLVTTNYERSINSQFSSNAGYSQKLFNNRFTMSMNARHSQNVSTGVATLNLPDFSLSMNRIYPLKSVVKNSKSPLAKLSFSHNFVAKNTITNSNLSTDISGLNVINASEIDETLELFPNLGTLSKFAKMGGKHSIPISTSFTLLNFFTVSPSFNYQEVWYTKELDYTYIPEEEGVRVDTVAGFSRAGSWTSGGSVNTRIYGTKFFKGDGKIQAIRHVATPSVSFSYNPDFGNEKYGVWEDVQINEEGDTKRISKYNNFAYGSPSGSESKSLSFSLSNNIEMKVRDDKDSTQEFKKVKLFDNLSVSSGYDFAKDTMRLSNISWSARTSVLKGAMSVNVRGTVDPYIYNPATNTRINELAWNNGQGLGNLSSFNTSLSWRLQPKKNGKKGQTEGSDDPYNRTDTYDSQINDFNQDNLDPNNLGSEQEVNHISQNPNDYVDFSLPWSLSLSYSINRTQRGYADPTISQTFSLSGSLSLTSKTQVSFRSGFDFEAMEATTTSITVSRDLHCWSLSFSYVPFGTYQSFSLSLRPKSPLLQQLKIDKRRSFQDNF